MQTSRSASSFALRSLPFAINHLMTSKCPSLHTYSPRARTVSPAHGSFVRVSTRGFWRREGSEDKSVRVPRVPPLSRIGPRCRLRCPAASAASRRPRCSRTTLTSFASSAEARTTASSSCTGRERSASSASPAAAATRSARGAASGSTCTRSAPPSSASRPPCAMWFSRRDGRWPSGLYVVMERLTRPRRLLPAGAAGRGEGGRPRRRRPRPLRPRGGGPFLFDLKASDVVLRLDGKGEPTCG